MLTDRMRFAEQLLALAKFHAKTLAADEIDGYWSCLRDKLTDEQFAAACERLQRGDWYPTPARILSAATRRTPVVEAAAIRLYNKVRECQSWSPEMGTIYDERKITRECGTFAAAVYVVAGGGMAFRAAILDEQHEPWLRKAWVTAYWAMLDDPISVPQITAGDRPALPVVTELAQKLSAP